MRSFTMRAVVLSAAILMSAGFAAQECRAQGYVYEARSYYVAPPVAYYGPVYAPAPIVVYEPVYAAPPPVVGYYYHTPAIPVRTHESWNYLPWRSRYSYDVKYPGGLEYEYRYKRDGGRIRVTGKWDD